MAKETKDWNELYLKFEKIYNHYPVQMARYSAFGKALNDGLINEEDYNEAQKYYGNLWTYVGD